MTNQENTFTDLTFFTNEEGRTLEDRFKAVLDDDNVQSFDILVGYFRTSGFIRLYNEFDKIRKNKGHIRILVGLDTDSLTVKKANEAEKEWRTEQQVKDVAQKKTEEEMSSAEDSVTVDESVNLFKKLIKEGVLEIKAHPSKNIHAKVYIIRYKRKDYGRVITGSSNFSESGLVEQYEFNVELKNSSDVRYAFEHFENLWKDAIDLSQLYIDTVEQKTHLSDKITPYELYLKFLYECFKDRLEINSQMVDMRFPDGFKELKYQKEAVLQLADIVEEYGGAFLSDVVGLGKTYIASLYMQNLPGKKLVICPPHIKSNWENAMRDFEVRGYRVESLGKLDSLIEEGTDKYSYVFVDEAHRFRNESTTQYKLLRQICMGKDKKIILITATPLNNSVYDFLPLLNLFLPDRNHMIPGIGSLHSFFSKIKGKMNKLEKSTTEYKEEVKNASKNVRDKILSHLMIRRTRTEIKKLYKEDLDKQGIEFPEVENPNIISYVFDKKTERVFNNTIENLKKLTLSRYKRNLINSMNEKGMYVNYEQSLIGLLKTMLVKRLESSRYAFLETVSRFIMSYEAFIKMYDSDRIYLGVKIDYALLESDEEAYFDKIEEKGEGPYSKKDFRKNLKDDLEADLTILRQIKAEWESVSKDTKKEEFLNKIKTDLNLRDNKLIVFTESTDTAVDLYGTLENEYGGKVLMFSSNKCMHNGNSLSSDIAKKLILDNFDPSKDKDDIRILITTDILAEGINLHKSNVIVNYDLPWNPTRVLQRIGRVNRIGSKHKKIYIYNLFPTSVSDSQIGLTDRIKEKVMAFAEALGNDTRYLTDDEEISTHGLFAKDLVEKVNSKETYEGTDENDYSAIEYVHVLENIRNENPALFNRIKAIPPKSRTARGYNLNCSEKLITFFKKGKHKLIYLCDGKNTPEELALEDAIRYFKCEKDCVKKDFDKERFYELLSKNKDAFEKRCNEEVIEKEMSGGTGKSNKEVAKRINLILQEYRNDKVAFTEDEEKFLMKVQEACSDGRIPKEIITTADKELGKTSDSREAYNILKKQINENWLEDNSKQNVSEEDDFRGIILSEVLIKE